MTDRGGGASLLPYTPADVTDDDDDDDCLVCSHSTFESRLIITAGAVSAAILWLKEHSVDLTSKTRSACVCITS